MGEKVDTPKGEGHVLSFLGSDVGLVRCVVKLENSFEVFALSDIKPYKPKFSRPLKKKKKTRKKLA